MEDLILKISIIMITNKVWFIGEGMLEATNQLDFEKAAMLRDLIV